MTTLPQTGANELVVAQSAAETAANEVFRHLDAGHTRSIIEDRDENDPPGSCADGARYLIAATASGAWTGHEGKLAIAVGTNASNGWLIQTVAVEGFLLYIRDENIEIRYNGSSWDTVATSGGASLNAQSGTTYTLVMGDANNIVELTNASAITLTIPPNASVAFPVGTAIELHQGDVGTVTVDPDTGVTLLSRGGLVDLAGENAIAAIRKVATNTWRLTGDIA